MASCSTKKKRAIGNTTEENNDYDGTSATSKRMRPNANDHDDSGGININSNTSSKSSLRVTLKSLRAELDHERRLRKLDHRQYEQEKARLERQVTFARGEVDLTKKILDEFRETSESHIQELIQQLKEFQERQEQREQQQEEQRKQQEEQKKQRKQQQQENDKNSKKVELWQRKCISLQQQLDKQNGHNVAEEAAALAAIADVADAVAAVAHVADVDDVAAYVAPVAPIVAPVAAPVAAPIDTAATRKRGPKQPEIDRENEMSMRKFLRIIDSGWKDSYTREYHDNKENQCLILKEGKAYCECCSNFVPARRIVQHLSLKMHKDNLMEKRQEAPRDDDSLQEN